MKLSVIASGSKGNCYLLHNDNEALMIEAGAPFKSVLALLKGDISKLVACLVSHEHKDHSAYVCDVLNHGIDVWMSAGTMHNIKLKSIRLPLMLESGCKLNRGGFSIIPFNTVHDAEEPLGFYINHEECGKVLFVTDSAYIPNTFKGLNNIMIECNYDEKLLEARTDIPESLKERIRDSHMSVDTCIEALKANNLGDVNNIVLMHVSEGDGDPEEFRKKVEKATNKIVNVAEPGLNINFDITPF